MTIFNIAALASRRLRIQQSKTSRRYVTVSVVDSDLDVTGSLSLTISGVDAAIDALRALRAELALLPAGGLDLPVLDLAQIEGR